MKILCEKLNWNDGNANEKLNWNNENKNNEKMMRMNLKKMWKKIDQTKTRKKTNQIEKQKNTAA